MDEATGVGSGDHFGTEFGGLFDGVDGDVAGTRDGDGFAGDCVASVFQHVVEEIDAAVASRFLAAEGATEFEALTGDSAGELVGETLILSEEIAHLAGTDADVTSGDVGVGSDVPVELGHEGLAKAHHFAIALSLGD